VKIQRRRSAGHRLPKARIPTLLLTKKCRTFQTPVKNFPGPFRSPQMFKYKEKTAFTYNIQSVVHCRKFSMKQNVDVSCSEFRWTYLHMVIWSTRKMHDLQGYFPRLSRSLNLNFQDLPGSKWFSRTVQVLEFSRKKTRTFQEAWEPRKAQFQTNIAALAAWTRASPASDQAGTQTVVHTATKEIRVELETQTEVGRRRRT